MEDAQLVRLEERLHTLKALMDEAGHDYYHPTAKERMALEAEIRKLENQKAAICAIQAEFAIAQENIHKAPVEMEPDL